MNKSQKKAVLEAILFTMGDAVEVDRLASVIEEDADKTRALLMELKDEYDNNDRGMTLMELEDSFQMCTKASMYEYLVKIAKTPRKYTISDSMLETLYYLLVF